MSCDVGKGRKGWRMSCDVGEVMERLENEQSSENLRVTLKIAGHTPWAARQVT